MSVWALIVVTCAYGRDFCDKLTTYYHSEAECGVAAQRVAKVAEETKPSGVIVYRCEEATGLPSLVAPAATGTAGKA